MDVCIETPVPGAQDQGYKAFTRIIAARSASQLVTRYDRPNGSHEKN
jgi:hypothetical protein